MEIERRAKIHRALGDVHRLAIVDGLVLGDHTVHELAELTGLRGNALAHHLNVLEDAGLIERRTSAGDHRRRYVVLRPGALAGPIPRNELEADSVLFVCTHNSARSQFAAALWRLQTGRDAQSAGSHPADRVAPGAVSAAARLGVDLKGARPMGYEDVAGIPDVVVSVCDRALEHGLPYEHAPHLHWSVPDPVETGTAAAFEEAFDELAERIGILSHATARRD